MFDKYLYINSPHNCGSKELRSSLSNRTHDRRLRRQLVLVQRAWLYVFDTADTRRYQSEARVGRESRCVTSGR